MEAVMVQFWDKKSASQSLSTGKMVTRSLTTCPKYSTTSKSREHALIESSSTCMTGRPVALEEATSEK